MPSVVPMLGQAHHFIAYAPEKVEYAVNRQQNEANRLDGVMDKRLCEVEYLAGSEYNLADIAALPGGTPSKNRGHERASQCRALL